MSYLNNSTFKLTFVLDEELEQFKKNVSSGNIYKAKIINQIDAQNYILLLNEQKIIVEFPQQTLVKDYIYLQVKNVAKKISLKMLGDEKEAIKSFMKMFPTTCKFKKKLWKDIFIKWIHYNIVLSDENMALFCSLYNNILKINRNYLFIIPELLILQKRWKLYFSNNVLNEILCFFKRGENSIIGFNSLINLFNNEQSIKDENSIFSSFLFEKKIPKLNKENLTRLSSLINSEKLIEVIRNELNTFLLENKGMLLYSDGNDVWNILWADFSSIKNSSYFSIIMLTLIEFKVLVTKISLNENIIKISFFSSHEELYEQIGNMANEFGTKKDDENPDSFIITNKRINLPEMIFFSKLKNNKKLKRII